MPKKLSLVVLILILILSFILRISGLNYGLPLHLHPDEWIQIEPAVKMFNWDLNPHVFYYPSFVIYFLFIVFKILNLLSPVIFKITASKSIFYLTGRFISVVFGTLTVLSVYQLGKKLFDERVALTAAFFLSLSSIHIRHSHYAIVDIPLTLFICLTIYFCLKIIEKEDLRNFILAGIMGGIASSTKYTAFLLLFIIYIAFLINKFSLVQGTHYNFGRERVVLSASFFIGVMSCVIALIFTFPQTFKVLNLIFSSGGKIEKDYLEAYFFNKIKFLFLLAGLFFISFSIIARYSTFFKKLIYIEYLNRKIIIAFLLFIITFLIISPYIILDFGSFWRYFKFALRVTAIGSYEGKLWVSAGAPTTFKTLLKVIISEYGLIFFIFFILGIFFNLDKKHLISFFWLGIYFLTIMSWKVTMIRFLLPIVVLMPIYASAFIFLIGEKISKVIKKNNKLRLVFSEKPERIIISIITFLCAIVPLKSSIETDSFFNKKSTLTEGFNWIEKNIKEKSRIVMIGVTPDLRLSDRKYLFKQKENFNRDKDIEFLKGDSVDYFVFGIYKYNEFKVDPILRTKVSWGLVKEIVPDELRTGPIIKIYKVYR